MATNPYVNKVQYGNSTLIDITDTTATASDVAQGKYFYLATGEKVAGTSTGGGTGGITQDAQGYLVLSPDGEGGPTPPTPPSPTPEPWARPSDWPDLSKMDVSGGNILYMTSYADEARGFCSFRVTCTGRYTVEVGTISGSTFTAESTQDYASNAYCELYYGSANGTYKVLRVTGTAITKLETRQSTAISIGDFHGYSNIQGIIDVVGKLPSGTSLSLGYMFNLVNVEIDGLNLSGSACVSMFYCCYSLASVDASGWNTDRVTSLTQMFYNCRSLTSLDVSGWDVGSVTDTVNMFNSCYALKSLDVSDWDVGAVTNMNNMFNNCYALKSLDVSDWDVGAVTNMSSMFSGCHALASLDVSDWDVGAVTNMSSMFNSCYALKSLDVSGWDFSGVVTASNAGSIFRSCYNVHGSQTIPATMTIIGSYCFNGMRSLDEWHFLATTPPTLNSTNAFSDMTDFGGKKIYVPSASVNAYKTAENWSTYADYIQGE